MADDPFAGYIDNGPAAPPSAPKADPFSGFEDLGPNSKPRLSMSASRAAVEGFLDTAGLGFRDEIYGASEASGLPGWMGGLRAPVGLGRLGYEYFSGKPGKATERYEEARDIARKVQRASEEEHPQAYLTGQVGGSIAAPGLAATKGATLGARAARAAVAGGLQGAAYGAGSGETPGERAIGAAEGGALGAVTGAVASPIASAAGIGLQKAGNVAKSAYDTLRAELNPTVGKRIVEDEAAKRIVASLPEQRIWQPEEVAAGARAGIPRAIGDEGGEGTLALARSAANQSPEARAALTTFAQERFAGQTRRAANFIRDLTGGADAAKDLDAIRERARIINQPRYRAAYAAGDRPVWSPELERLTASPTIQRAMGTAITSGKDRAVAEGFGEFNPGVTVSPDGRIAFGRNPRTGGTAYPNIQYWDYVQRDLSDAYKKIVDREPDKAHFLNDLHQQLNTELDRLVPEFQNARMGAWRAFQSEDALEAGRKFVTLQGKNGDFAREIGKMSAPDRQLFARGFASELSDRVLELRDNQNVINQAFLTSPASKQRIAMALGPERAARLETYLRAESLSDRLRTALGNSTTARQLAEMGLAGAGTLALGHGAIEGEWDAKHALTAALLFGAAYGKHRAQALDTGVARRIGEMLTSEDPMILRRGVDIVTKSRKLSASLREAGDRISAALAGRITPTVATRAVVSNGGSQ